jgi:NAD+--asparagine ADP-ribosyltransferase
MPECEQETYAERIKNLVDETVDRISETLDEFSEQAGGIVKDAAENENVEKIVDKITDFRKSITEATADIIKSVTKAVVDSGETIANLIKKDDDDEV